VSAISGLIKVTKKGATAPAKAPPFYSAVDNAVDNLPNKATPEQMIKELLKQKEVKAQELIDRGIDKKLGVPIVQKERTVKLKKPDAKGNTEKVEKYFEVTPGEKGAKAITKDEVINTVEQNPPKQITEDIMGDITPEMIDQKIEDMIHKEVIDELGPRPRLGYEREDWLEDYDRLVEQKSRYSDDYYEAAKNSIKEDGGFKAQKYDEYKLPGGENYREILLKLPTFDPRKERQLMELEANLRRMNPADFPPGYLDSMQEQAAKLKAEKAAAGDEFRTPHWDQPNVLAHIRVQDRVGPNGEKVLHVEEIQSDWHQVGRKKGYAKPETKLLKGTVEEQPSDFDFAPKYRVNWEDGTFSGGYANREQAQARAALGKSNAVKGTPDAPFKKNWHELAMKRLINYASENGYDKIAITPGAEQAKRYDLSKQVDSISWEKDANGKITFTPEKNGASLTAPQTVDPQELSSHLGKDVAEKILKSQEDGGFLEGLDLKVGGKGMVGFYDQILPAYLNKYGEKYGAKVSPIEVTRPPRDSTLAFGYPGGDDYVAGKITWNEFLQQSPHAAKEFSTQLHSFDITPQMREEVLTKGQPLYQQIGIPAATGAAGAGMLEDEPVFNRSEKVNITDNPDAMFLELNDQHFGVGGAAKKAIKALKGTQKVLPAAEREANLAKMLEDSAIKDRLYHGTNDDFRSFSNNKLGRNTDGNASSEGYAQTARVGHWFNTKPMGQSPEKYGAGYKVDMPVYLSIKNPKREMSLDWLAQGLESKKGMAYRRELEKQGYDGVVLPDEEFGAESWVAFRPEQIKSAIGNRGTYDTTKPDINEAQGGLATLKRK
jgi:hypothetical protein